MVEPPQQPFARRYRPEIVRGRQAEHRQQPCNIHRYRDDRRRGCEHAGQRDQRGGGDQPGDEAQHMHDAIGDQLGAIVVPVNRAFGVDPGMRHDLLEAEDRHSAANTLFSNTLSELIWRIHDDRRRCDTHAAARSATATVRSSANFPPERRQSQDRPHRSDCRTNRRFPASFAGNSDD